MSAFFSHGAKKGMSAESYGRGKMLIRGYEVRRTDSFRLLTTTMTMLFEHILQGSLPSIERESY